MHTEKFKGFVLQHFPISDSRSVVSLFTLAGGKRKAVFRASKKQSKAYLSPLTELHFQLSGREHQELKTMSQVSLEAQNFDAATHYCGLTLLQHWAFLLDRSQPDEHEDERVYRLLRHALDSLPANPKPEQLSARNLYFETWLLHFCGMLSRNPRLVNYGGQGDPSGDISPAVFHVLRQVFEQRIEDFAGNALKLGSLAQAYKVLGRLWEQFLNVEIKTGKLLLQQLNLRGTP